MAALWFLVLVNYLDRVAMSFAGPAIMTSLSLTPADFGIVLSSFGIGYVLAQIPGGLIADRWGAKALLVGGPVLWAVFTGPTGLVTTVGAFVVVRICFGLSEGLSTTSVYKIIGENFDAKERSRVLAICSTAIPLAPAFTGAFVGKLIGAYGWQAMFLIMTVPALMSSLLCYMLIPGEKPAPAAPLVAPAIGKTDRLGENASFRSVLGRRSLWALSLAALAWNITYWGYLSWMPSYLVLSHHIDLKALGPLGGIPYLFAFVGLLFGGWLGSAALHRHCPQLGRSDDFSDGGFPSCVSRDSRLILRFGHGERRRGQAA
jgi:MFS family permease